jgi:hypothetical protein
MTTITRVYRADWAPHIEQAARAIATAAAFVYVCGYVTGRWLHRLNDRLSALLVRKRGLTPEERALCLEVLATAPVRYECAAVPARCGIQSPMARAVSKVKGGMSQRAAASICGVSRSSLQRALKG